MPVAVLPRLGQLSPAVRVLPPIRVLPVLLPVSLSSVDSSYWDFVLLAAEKCLLLVYRLTLSCFSQGCLHGEVGIQL